MNQEKEENQKPIKSLFIEKDGIQCFFSHLGTAVEISAKKNEVWFKSPVLNLPDEDLEFIWREFEKEEIEMISINDLKFKIFAKGFNAMMEQDKMNSKEMKEIFSLKAENYKLSEKIKNLESSKNNIVWITVLTDNIRRSYQKEKEIIKFVVVKKKPNTILLIDGIVCVHGESWASSGQIWTYGGKTTAFGQTECYANNNGQGRNVTTKSVIYSHIDIGPQELVLKWDSQTTPFNIINPNISDSGNYLKVQTQSAYTVWEISQD